MYIVPASAIVIELYRKPNMKAKNTTHASQLSMRLSVICTKTTNGWL